MFLIFLCKFVCHQLFLGENDTKQNNNVRV